MLPHESKAIAAGNTNAALAPTTETTETHAPGRPDALQNSGLRLIFKNPSV